MNPHAEQDIASHPIIPSPQMVANMKVGKMDGYCIGEPWKAKASRRGRSRNRRMGAEWDCDPCRGRDR